MDIQKYIASGILEQYVLGQLSPAEKREVEQHATQYPEIRQELSAIEEAMEQFAQLNAVQPPANLEGQILDKIRSNAAPQKPVQAPAPTGGLYRTFGIVGIAAALGAGIWGFSQMQQKNDLQSDLTTLQADLDTLQADCSRQLAKYQQTEQIIAFLRDGNTSPVALAGTDKAPDAKAIIFWNAEQKKSYLDAANMPPVPSDKQYQLWAIVDGAPVDMGVFDVVVNENGLVEVPFIENPQAFAVTLEPRGGNPTPTLEEMYVIGNPG